MMKQIANQNNLSKTLIFLILISFTFGCKKDNSNLAEIKKGFYTIDAVGKKKNASYTFCGAVGTEVNYSYRIGNWTFKTKDSIKIAEGKYDTIIKVSDFSSGSGCEYTYVENTFDIEKWKFWNKDGKIIKPTKQLINLIESSQEEYSFYFE